MSDGTEAPPAKRAKLQEDTPVEAAPRPIPSSVPPYSVPSEFSFDDEKGLFGLVKQRLGHEAPSEEDTGILEYVNASIPSFSGIIKHRFTDFQVFEVGSDGVVVRLKDISGPVKPPPQVQQVETAAADALPLWNETVEAAFAAVLSDEKLSDLKELVLAGPPAPVPQKKKGDATTEVVESPAAAIPLSFVTDVMESREARGAFHGLIRSSFNEKLSSEAAEGENGNGLQYIKVVWSGKKEAGNRARHNRRPNSDTPQYIHFTLQKTNKEMHDALSGLARTFHLQSKDLGIAGTKDKRAVTVQRVSIRRGNKSIEDIWKAVTGRPSKGGRGGRGGGRGGRGGASTMIGGSDFGLRVGDVEYATTMLDLGMSKGNKFVITLRDIKVDDPSTIQRAMDTLTTQGFINYFGMQRFGTGPIPTHVLGLALLRSNWALAAHLILRPRDGESDDAGLARVIFREGKVQEAARMMPRRCVAEKAILEQYAKMGTDDHLSAISKIPKNLRMMYVHAYQSYIWNRVVSERIKLFGCDKPVEGDLVYTDGDKEDDEITESGEVKPAPVIESLDADLENDGTPPPAAGVVTLDSSKMLSKIAAAHPITQADIDSGKYTMADIILPMPGYAVVYPAGKLGVLYREIMESDRLNPDDMFRKQKEFSLGGAYRKIMHCPKDVSHRLITYTSSSQDLTQSDEDVLLRREPPIVLAYDPALPLPLGSSLALQLELTLGSSTYATMALREVLKDKTSGAHQASLTHAMEERMRVEGAKVEALGELEKMEVETAGPL